MDVNKRLQGVKHYCEKLEGLLEGAERGPLVMAEIAHVSAHLLDYVQQLDLHMTYGHEPPVLWSLIRPRVHNRAEETAPAL